MPLQRERALDGLVSDGLVDALPSGDYAAMLPCWPGGDAAGTTPPDALRAPRWYFAGTRATRRANGPDSPGR